MKTTIVLLILFSTIRNPKSTFGSRLPMKPARKKTKARPVRNPRAGRSHSGRGLSIAIEPRFLLGAGLNCTALESSLVAKEKAKLSSWLN
jgi:hypothetical protein